MRKLFEIIGLLVVLLALVAGGFLSYDWYRVGLLRQRFPEACYEKNSKVPKIVMHKKAPARWVPINQISREAIGAVIVSEDWAFFDHPGFDLNQIKESIETNIKRGQYARGASTITQQVVRNVFLSQEKSLTRKSHEVVLAVMLERRLTKRRILEIYLNIAEWGEDLYGIRAAAKRYFKKSPAELNAREGAFLAMLLPSPERYSVSYRRGELTNFANQSVDRILNKMVQAGYIDNDRAQAASCEPLAFESDDENRAIRPWCEPNPVIINE